MLDRSIVANWVLTAAIIAAFVGLLIYGSNTGPATDTAIEAPLPPAPIESSAAEPDRVEEDAVPPADDTPAPPAPVSRGNFPQTLSICGSMTISNRPSQIEELRILNYRPTISVKGVDVAVAPTGGGCFSSGFGMRSGRIHKGIDIHNPDPVPIFAAASGTIRELKYRDDYGNMIVLDHGSGVFTRYAHLQSFAKGLARGGSVTRGQQIGIMGNTASYSIPRHLHYELLTGDWDPLAGSFALTAENIISKLDEN